MNENDKRAELILARAQGVLEDMPLRQPEILAGLSAAERAALGQQLHGVAVQLAAAEEEVALLHAASDLLTVVEGKPLLRELLLPPPWIYNESAAQRETWLEEWEQQPQEASPRDDERWQELVKIRNIMLTELEKQINMLLREADDAHR